MRNNFILTGPVNDSNQFSSSKNIYDMLHNIAKQKLNFVSRTDDSGTNKKEIALWKKAGIDPYGSNWYIETGNGMAASLKVAEDEKGYILIDRATFLVRKSDKSRIVFEDNVNLANPYSVIAVNASKHSKANKTGANKFIRWLVSAAGQKVIAGYKYNGVQIFSAPI